MTKEEVSRLLIRASAVDNRNVTALAIEAWSEVLERVDYLDSVEALRRFRMRSDAWLLPYHIADGVRILLAERARAARVAKALDYVPEARAVTKPRDWNLIFEAAKRGVDPDGK